MSFEHLIRDPLPGYLDAEPAIPHGNIIECLNIPAMLHQKYQLDLFFVGSSQLSPEPALILAIEILSAFIQRSLSVDYYSGVICIEIVPCVELLELVLYPMPDKVPLYMLYSLFPCINDDHVN